jgi:hypothetical protein
LHYNHLKRKEVSYTKNTLTKVQALVQLIKENGGQANWQRIYSFIGNYYPDLKDKMHDPIAKAGVRGVLYRDCDKGRNIFTKFGNATFALKGAE